MTSREKLIAATGVILFVLLIFGFRAWMEERDARTKAEATEAAQQTVIDQARQQAAAAIADEAKIASDLQAKLAAIEKQKEQPVTAPQFVIDLNKAIPNLPQPVTIVEPTQDPNRRPDSPAPAPAVQIPGADLQDLKAYALNCDANSAKLEACTKTSADQVAELNAAKTELWAMQKDRDAWKSAAGKGNLWQKLGKRVKCLAIVGGVSAAGAWADKQMPARGALIGATAGGVGCELF